MTESTSPSTLPQQAPSDLEYSSLCASCGYSLVGLTSSSICPECGYDNHFAPPSLSLDRRSMSYVRDLRNAAYIAAGGAGMCMLGAISPCAIPLGVLLHPLGIVLIVFGVWGGTRADPGLSPEISGARLRKNARGTVIAASLLDFAIFACAYLLDLWVAFLVYVLFLIAAILAVCAMYDYLRWIALRARRAHARSPLRLLAILATVTIFVLPFPFLSVLTFGVILAMALFAANVVNDSLARMLSKIREPAHA